MFPTYSRDDVGYKYRLFYGLSHGDLFCYSLLHCFIKMSRLNSFTGRSLSLPPSLPVYVYVSEVCSIKSWWWRWWWNRICSSGYTQNNAWQRSDQIKIKWSEKEHATYRMILMCSPNNRAKKKVAESWSVCRYNNIISILLLTIRTDCRIYSNSVVTGYLVMQT